MRFAHLVTLALVLDACTQSSQCPAGFEQAGGACVPRDAGGMNDAAADDGGRDAGSTDANLPCGMVCGARTPVCDVARRTCVECLSARDCVAPRTTCTANRCVQCTMTTESSACGGNSCDPATGLCTTTARASRDRCQACVADSECMAGTRCVPMMFMGTRRPGGFCLAPDPGGGTGCGACGTSTEPRVSLSGATAAAYCTVPESVTTCEATLRQSRFTPCMANADCGAAGLMDSQCSAGHQCFARCSASCQCPSGFGYMCRAGVCG